jgi:hypothetical protein
VDISRTLSRACSPDGGAVIDAARVVIMFVDERLERKHDGSGPIALMALGDRWLC